MNAMDPKLFFGWWVLLLVAGEILNEILRRIFKNPKKILTLIWKVCLNIFGLVMIPVVSFYAAYPGPNPGRLYNVSTSGLMLLFVAVWSLFGVAVWHEAMTISSIWRRSKLNHS